MPVGGSVDDLRVSARPSPPRGVLRRCGEMMIQPPVSSAGRGRKMKLMSQ